MPTKTALQSHAARAEEMKQLINLWMAANGYTKVNLMGHSQGGLDARYMVANLGMASKVRVLTSIATPHRGAPMADIVLNVIPSWLQPHAVAAVGYLSGILLYGNTKQDLAASLKDLTIAGSAAFNTLLWAGSARLPTSARSFMVKARS
ncbi:esterase/lipase family protein [Turneriella parva]|uniref:esterase/lipase family protein n=1 Tax=Turneriella parva TaxID=29510 RepID=UPI0002E88D5C|nr:alpha/beta fold hydrolase [Turneriella parva]